MTDVLFIFPTDGAEFHMGIASMSAQLKRHGYTTALTIIHLLEPEESKARLQRALKEKAPSTIAVSVMSNHWEAMSDWLSWIDAKTDAPILVGGWHPTMCPHQVLEHPSVDAICVGEGEGAILDWVQRGPQERLAIPNIWTRQAAGDKTQNELRPLITDLDGLSQPDIDIFDFQGLIERGVNTILGDWGVNKVAPFAFGRGCYYRCGYCCNHSLRKLYGVPASAFVRRRSVESALDEIRDVTSRYDVRWIELWDEDVTLDRDWFKAFAREYPKQIDIPFIAMVRPQNVQRGELGLLRDANCRVILMGVETGDEDYRRKVMHRHETNEEIIRAFREAREYGLATVSTNMAGLPFEDEAGVEKTLELNELLEPDFFYFFTFNPFFGTDFYRLAEENGLLIRGPSQNYGAYESPMIKGIDPDRFASFHRRAAEMRQRFDEGRRKRFPGLFDA